MRRALAASVLAGALLMVGACGGSDYAANTKEVCDSLEQVLKGEGTLSEITAEMEKAVEGKTAEEEINAASVDAMKKVFGEWAAAIEAEAPKAEDPAFKAAIIAFGQELSKAAEGIQTIDDSDKVLEGAAVETAGEKIDEFCS